MEGHYKDMHCSAPLTYLSTVKENRLRFPFGTSAENLHTNLILPKHQVDDMYNK